MSRLQAKLLASASIVPKGSHAVIVMLAICLIAGFCFLWFKPVYSAAPFMFSVVFIAIIVPFWSVSHRNVDAHLSAPTSLAHLEGDRLTTLTTDPSSFKSPEGMRALERCLSMLQQRRPLPNPDGLVDESGSPIPESASKAVENIKAINELVKQIQEDIVSTTAMAVEEEHLDKLQSQHERPSPETIEGNELDES